MKKTCLSALGNLDEITLIPSLQASLGVQNRKTGEKEEENLLLSTHLSLSKALLIGSGAVFALHVVFVFCRLKKQMKTRKKYREKMKRMKEKMSKS